MAMALTRGAAVDALYNRTELSMRTIVGAFAILDKSKLPLTASNLAAASFTAFKTYEVAVDESIPFFLTRMIPALLQSDCRAFKSSEMAVLQAVQFGVPSRTRVDQVEVLMREVGAPNDLPYYRAAVLALLVPGIDRVPDAMYTRSVLCAAALLATPHCAPSWLARLPTEKPLSVTRDDIMRWAVRITEVAGPPEEQPRGVKRGRDE